MQTALRSSNSSLEKKLAEMEGQNKTIKKDREDADFKTKAVFIGCLLLFIIQMIVFPQASNLPKWLIFDTKWPTFNIWY